MPRAKQLGGYGASSTGSTKKMFHYFAVLTPNWQYVASQPAVSHTDNTIRLYVNIRSPASRPADAAGFVQAKSGAQSQPAASVELRAVPSATTQP